MTKTNDSLVRFPTERMDALREAVVEGSYENEAELLEEAFEHWKLEKILNDPTERQKQALRRLWDEGLASGESIPFDIEDIKRKARGRMAARSKS